MLGTKTLFMAFCALSEAKGMDIIMNKTISMSIRVSEDELDKLKQAARLEAYASYSEFIRRTALKEAERVIKNNKNQDGE